MFKKKVIIFIMVLIVVIISTIDIKKYNKQKNQNVNHNIQDNYILKKTTHANIFIQNSSMSDIKNDFNIRINNKKSFDDINYSRGNLKYIETDQKNSDNLNLSIYNTNRTINSQKIIKHNKSYKPKLAIIIDDISNKRELNKLLSIGLKLNYSFLPPTKNHPNSAKITNNLKFYIVHIPLQAPKTFTSTENFVLNINDSYNTIYDFIKRIEEEFHNPKYINNHTGSIFTSNYSASKKLLTILQKEHIQFIDSKTTPHSQIPKISKELGLKYMGRNVFLDNNTNVSYITKQIDKAIKVAKRRGKAIAIGHPHYETINALILNKKKLEKEVKLVYIYEF